VAAATAVEEFTADDLYIYRTGGQGMYNVTAGGDLSGAPYTSTPGVGGVYGTVAWSADRQVMYVAGFADKVVTVTPSGTVTDFATGITDAISVLITDDGHILTGSFADDAIYDITGGGDFSDAEPLVTNLLNPGGMVQLATGEVLVTSGSGGSSVYDINYPTGGEMDASDQYATGFVNPYDIMQAPDGEIYVSLDGMRVMRITGGGNFNLVPGFATTTVESGLKFRGLVALRDGTLLALTWGSGDVAKIYDITAGGEIDGDTVPWGVMTGNLVTFDRVPSDCGDGDLQAGEMCDDGNTNNHDACPYTCQYAVCGDHVTYDEGSGTEECDDGNEDDHDDCTNTCTVAICGDGVLHDAGSGTEECDDGDAMDRDDCKNDCTVAFCGDGIVHDEECGTEECDDANANDHDDCLNDCAAAICGDGVLNSDGAIPEACDDGNAIDGDACTNACTVAVCGDGVVHNQGGGTEECDDGNDVDGDACTNNCTVAFCGDGVVHDHGGGTEACDDGNEIDGDDCTNSCDVAFCGDGVVHDEGSGTEACDDGNEIDGDGCTNDCTEATCGDGVVHDEDGGTEECDDGAGNSDTAADACRTDCAAPSCGDGVIDAGEECDDGDDNGPDGKCTETCEEKGCGCSANPSAPATPHLLGLGALFLLARRRRTAS